MTTATSILAALALVSGINWYVPEMADLGALLANREPAVVEVDVSAPVDIGTPVEVEYVTESTAYDGYVTSHADEPYTVTVDGCTITVETAVHTSIHIYAHEAGVVAPEPDQERIFDLPGTVGTVELGPGEWSYSVVVVVNGATQVSTRQGEVACG